MIPDLKPCPFCGGKATWDKEGFFDEENYIRCSKCKARIRSIFTRYQDELPEALLKVANIWNTRKDTNDKE